ncbi:MAG TPA: hypothetical protein PLF61_05940, partial [Candidatus Goldiibacteriota bacterium]|nr:hypothetical protein [Candidatus Goldiibacteriota bacterium]
MERMQILEHKGKKILYLDFSKANYEEAKEIMNDAQKIIFSSEPNSLLIIDNFTDAEVTPQATYKLKEFVMQNKPYIKASAVMGVGGIKRVLLNTIIQHSGRKFYVFNNI